MKILNLAIIFTILLLTPHSKSHASEQQITIGSKSFTESLILAEILAQLLEKKFNVSVNRKFGLGGTKVAFDALRNKDIDVYPEYTGTGYSMILNQKEKHSKKKIHQIVSERFKKDYGILWSNPLGFNNTYAIAVLATNPKYKDITKLTELAELAKDVNYAAPHEFMERSDGQDAFSKAYNLQFDQSKIKAMEAGLIYSALKQGFIDLGVVYSTDGRIKTSNLKLLEDDLSFFPPYDSAFIFNLSPDSEEKYQKVRQAIKLLEGSIQESKMITMNDSADGKKIPIETIANNFLAENQLIKGSQENSQRRKDGFWGYLITNRDYLTKITFEHIYLCTSSIVIAMLVSIPLGIFMTRVNLAAKVVFPIINIIQTIPSIALLGALIPIFGIGVKPALFALFLYAILPLVNNTYVGIKGVDKTLIDASRGIGLTKLQILTNVELPLAFPVILTGLRTAGVIVIGTATLAALIGAGGLGDPIFRGVSTVNSQLILLGAVPAALLAVSFDQILKYTEKRIISRGTSSDAGI